MAIDRRAFLVRASAVAAAAAVRDGTRAGTDQPAMRYAPERKLRKISVEEHFSIPEVAAALRCTARTLSNNLDMRWLHIIYDAPEGTRAPFRSELLDVDGIRLTDMDRHGVDMQLLSLTSPGVQMFDADTAVALASLVNDHAAEAVKRHPDRFAALAAFAPHDPHRAVTEMERAIRTLKLNGFIVNSHTNNEYLDQQKFWPILEAAEALNGAIYIHPRAPADTMAAPMSDYGMGGALWGFGVETGTHAVRLIMSGVLDRYPKLRIVLGHMGEGVPFWLARLDSKGSPGSEAAQTNRLKPSEYFKRNFWIATTGVLDHLALRYCIDKIGADRIMWATDYPYEPAGPAVSFLESAPISDTDREMIAHRNAERVFNIQA